MLHNYIYCVEGEFSQCIQYPGEGAHLLCYLLQGLGMHYGFTTTCW